jgi:hypothetical protein
MNAPNPLLDEWTKVMGPHFQREQADMAHFRRTGHFPEWTKDRLNERMAPFRARHELVVKYAWAIPTGEAIAAIAAASPAGVVEIGAGTGYWAGLLRVAGVNVLAYDEAPYDNIQAQGKFSHVDLGGPEKAALWPSMTLFLCWPPYATPMALLCLDAYKGSTLAYVGEGAGGCNGDDSFHDTLSSEWTVETSVDLPQWDGIHDDLTIYRRKTKVVGMK